LYLALQQQLLRINRNLAFIRGFTRFLSRQGAKDAKSAKEEEKGYYIWGYRCTSRFILFTIVNQVNEKITLCWGKTGIPAILKRIKQIMKVKVKQYKTYETSNL